MSLPLPQHSRSATALVSAIVLAAISAPAVIAQPADPYGIGEPLAASGTGVDAGPATAVVEAASGLDVTLVSDQVGIDADMIALWPDSMSPTHAIICNEVDPEEVPQASVQVVDLADGTVADMVSGLVSCDPAKRTPWGTVVVGEEEDDGRVYEMIDPLNVSGVTVDRAAGTSSDPRVVARPALGQLAYEGIVILPDGTVYYADERRPEEGSPGGGMYKFVPEAPYEGGEPITDLAASPLAAGSVWVARLGTREAYTDWGQGSELGAGRWEAVEMPADSTTFPLHEAAQEVGMTGWYRPEDMALDPIAAAAGTVRICWNNTGRDEDGAANWGETLCLTDQPADDIDLDPAGTVPVVGRFVQGNPALRMPDNLDFDPATGNLWIEMDATTSADDATFGNDDVWVCLPDGDDVDELSDGCERALTLLDGGAEFSGIEFLADGSAFYQHLQHRTQDGDATPGTSDLVLVTLGN